METEIRKGDWIQTYTGKMFYPLDPRVEEIDIFDVAHALSNVCRFTGHVKTFYSVSQHSVLASDKVPAEYKLTALLHDASEFAIADVARPIKRLPEFKFYREIEDNLMKFMSQKFNTIYPLPPCVVEADNRMLTTEMQQLMGKPPKTWADLYEPYDIIIKPWAPEEAERIFLKTFFELIKSTK